VLKHYGDNAEAESARRVDELAEAGDYDSEAVWRQHRCNQAAREHNTFRAGTLSARNRPGRRDNDGPVARRQIAVALDHAPSLPAIALPQVKRSIDVSRRDTGLLIGSATAGSLVRSAAIALERGMLASMLLGLMMVDHTAGPSPKEAMMAGIMPGDPADYRTFETAGGGR
jgi:hypothetical protein